MKEGMELKRLDSRHQRSILSQEKSSFPRKQIYRKILL
jgi:hypothetical protein